MLWPGAAEPHDFPWLRRGPGCWIPPQAEQLARRRAARSPPPRGALQALHCIPVLESLLAHLPLYAISWLKLAWPQLPFSISWAERVWADAHPGVAACCQSKAALLHRLRRTGSSRSEWLAAFQYGVVRCVPGERLSSEVTIHAVVRGLSGCLQIAQHARTGLNSDGMVVAVLRLIRDKRFAEAARVRWTWKQCWPQPGARRWGAWWEEILRVAAPWSAGDLQAAASIIGLPASARRVADIVRKGVLDNRLPEAAWIVRATKQAWSCVSWEERASWKQGMDLAGLLQNSLHFDGTLRRCGGPASVADVVEFFGGLPQ